MEQLRLAPELPRSKPEIAPTWVPIHGGNIKRGQGCPPGRIRTAEKNPGNLKRKGGRRASVNLIDHRTRVVSQVNYANEEIATEFP